MPGSIARRRCPSLYPRPLEHRIASRMTAASETRPSIEAMESERPRLLGSWTLEHAAGMAAALREAAAAGARPFDATGVERLDSLGVLHVLRHERRQGRDFGGVRFRTAHLGAAV